MVQWETYSFAFWQETSLNIRLRTNTRKPQQNRKRCKPIKTQGTRQSRWLNGQDDLFSFLSPSKQIPTFKNISRTSLSSRSRCIVTDCSESCQSELRWERESLLCLIMYLRSRAAKKLLQRTNNTSISIHYRRGHSSASRLLTKSPESSNLCQCLLNFL